MADGEYLNKKCPVCLKPLWGYRRTKIYCSATCRNRAHRKPTPEAKIKEFYDEAHSGIMGLVTVCGRDLDGYRAQMRLKALALEILQAASEDVQRKIYEDLRQIYG